MKVLLANALLALFVGNASARDVVIVTSFPKELFETYKKAFEAKDEKTLQRKSFPLTYPIKIKRLFA